VVAVSFAREDLRALAFDVRPTAPGTGVFAVNAERIKRRYVVTDLTAHHDQENDS